MSKTVLIAGAGLVSQPVGDILVAKGHNVIYGCRNIKTAQETAQKVNEAVKSKGTGTSASAIALDVHNAQQLAEAVSKVDLVVSLVPPPDHPLVIDAAISHKKNVLTTSYVSPDMEKLHQKATGAGIVVLNELGLDPGLDHLWAVKCLTDIVDEGGKCTLFESYCGGLPAPECSDNALGYRFSWSPSGVLRALDRVAKYLEGGKPVEKSGVSLMESAKPFISPYKGYNFECYANGDSLPYDKRYPGLSEATDIIRGSLRYSGFANTCKCLIQIGFIDMSTKDFLKQPIPWAEATAQIVGANGSSEDAVISAITSKHKFADKTEHDNVLRTLRQMGIFSQNPIVPQAEPSPFFTLCQLLQEQGTYAPEDRDLVFLQHTFEVTNKDGSRSAIYATLIEYGVPGGYSAMAKLVGIPAAVGCLAILNGEIPDKGILRPTNEKLARPLRETLAKEYNITMQEKRVAL